MKAKIKVLSYYISMIILSLMTLALSLISILKYTVMNENYIIKQLEKNNYYEKLHKSIKQEMSYYIIQSGLTDEVLDNIYTEDMIKKEVNSLITNFYYNKKINVDTKEVSNNLNKNIQDYLLKNNIIADDQEALNRFVEEMIKIYENELKITDHINNLQSSFIKLDNLIDLIFTILVISIPIIGLLLHKFYKRIIFTIPTISTSVLLLLGNYLFFHRVDVKNILFWNENISEIIKSILWSLKETINKEAIILIIIGIITFILGYILTNKKQQEENTIIEDDYKEEKPIDKEKKSTNKNLFDKLKKIKINNKNEIKTHENKQKKKINIKTELNKFIQLIKDKYNNKFKSLNVEIKNQEVKSKEENNEVKEKIKQNNFREKKKEYNNKENNYLNEIILDKEALENNNKNIVTKKLKRLKNKINKQSNKLVNKIKNRNEKDETLNQQKNPNIVEELYGYTYGTSTTHEEKNKYYKNKHKYKYDNKYKYNNKYKQKYKNRKKDN